MFGYEMQWKINFSIQILPLGWGLQSWNPLAEKELTLQEQTKNLFPENIFFLRSRARAKKLALGSAQLRLWSVR